MAKIPLSLYPAQANQERARRELRQRQLRASSNYSTFQSTYQDDPGGFVLDCFQWRGDEGPAFYQAEILQQLPAARREAVRGPHGLGKTCVAAQAVLWFALTRDGRDWKAITTASAWRQLEKYLWPEIHKWARRLDWAAIGRPAFNETELLKLALNLKTGSAFAVASDNAAFIEGAHADELLYIFDEAKEIPGDTWDAAEGAFSTGSCYALAISTPGEPQGRFYEIHSRKAGLLDWQVRHVRKEEAIAAGRMDAGWAEARRQQWGEQSAVYQNRVAGEFAAQEADGVIPLAWIEAANRRWQEWHEAGRPGSFVAAGVDVARSGEDQSVLALRFGEAVDTLRYYRQADTMATTGNVKAVLDAYGGRAVVDVIGIGAGVVDRLREQGKPGVVAFNAGARTEYRDASGELGFVNVRSAAWWNLRELLNPASGHNVALPDDDLLTGDLAAPRWKMQSGGVIAVESKDEIRKRLGRSTDSGDAVIQAFWSEEEGAQVGTIGTPW